MNYLLLTPDLFSADGGIARILRLYLKGLCEIAGESDSVRLVSLNDRLMDQTDLRRYSDERLTSWEVCSRNKLHFAKASKRMCRPSTTIVCGHIGQLPVAWFLSKICPRVNYYLVAHGIEVWRSFSFLERRALLGAQKVLCVSDFTRRKLLEHCPIPDERVFVLPNALDPYLDPKKIPAATPGNSVILTISRLSVADGYKGIEHLIAAMAAVRTAIPAARLRIVGRGDGLPGLQALTRKLGLQGAVEFAGYRSDAELSEDFKSCDLFALPSLKEGFGLVYLEAMANGRPCLGANEGGTPEVITPDSGVLVEYGKIPEIAAAMTSALTRKWNPESLYERAQHFSYLRFKERFASLIAA